jgi:hypothetical protein
MRREHRILGSHANTVRPVPAPTPAHSTLRTRAPALFQDRPITGRLELLPAEECVCVFITSTYCRGRREFLVLALTETSNGKPLCTTYFVMGSFLYRSPHKAVGTATPGFGMRTGARRRTGLR